MIGAKVENGEGLAFDLDRVPREDEGGNSEVVDAGIQDVVGSGIDAEVPI